MWIFNDRIGGYPQGDGKEKVNERNNNIYYGVSWQHRRSSLRRQNERKGRAVKVEWVRKGELRGFDIMLKNVLSLSIPRRKNGIIDGRKRALMVKKSESNKCNITHIAQWWKAKYGHCCATVRKLSRDDALAFQAFPKTCQAVKQLSRKNKTEKTCIQTHKSLARHQKLADPS